MIAACSSWSPPQRCGTDLQGELLVPEAPQPVLGALAVRRLRVQLRVRLGELSAAAPVVLQQLGELVAVRLRRAAELGRARLHAAQPRLQPAARLPHTKLLQGEGLDTPTRPRGALYSSKALRHSSSGSSKVVVSYCRVTLYRSKALRYSSSSSSKVVVI